MRIKEVLPAPFGPNNPNEDFSFTWMETLERAFNPAKDFSMLMASIIMKYGYDNLKWLTQNIASCVRKNLFHYLLV